MDYIRLFEKINKKKKASCDDPKFNIDGVKREECIECPIHKVCAVDYHNLDMFYEARHKAVTEYLKLFKIRSLLCQEKK